MSEFVVIDEFAFEERYRPLLNDDGSWREFWPGEPGADEILAVAIAEGRRWTMLDVDGLTMLSSGRHFVNRLGYYVSRRPVPDECEISVYDPEDFASLSPD